MADRYFKIMKARKAYDFNIANTNKPSEDIMRLIAEAGVAMDAKLDGTRAIVEVDADGNIKIYGRGTVQKTLHSDERVQRVYNQQFPELVRKVAPELALSRFDCEITITDPDTGLENYNVLETRVSRKKDINLYADKYPATINVFDVQMALGEDVTGMSLADRRQILEDLEVAKNMKRSDLMRLARTSKEKKILVDRMLELGSEGVMIKDLEAKYVDGRGDWFKAKRTHTEDVIVLGISPGQGKFKPYFGKLHCYQFNAKGDLEFVCDVGGGFNFEQMAFIRDYFGKYYDKPKSRTDMRTRYHLLKELEHVMVIEIKHYGIVKRGRRHPVFVRIREDKDATECMRREGAEEDSLDEWL